MSQQLARARKPALATDIPAAWIANVRGIIVRDGLAVRASFWAPCIEVQCINTGAWQPLNLSTNTHLFVSEQERDVVLSQMVGESPIQ